MKFQFSRGVEIKYDIDVILIFVTRQPMLKGIVDKRLKKQG